jgi:proprotein convertase subtilisin/kexin type 5
MFADSATTTCTTCNSPCLLCYSVSKCKSCVSGYLLYQDVCAVACPSGYFPSANSSYCITCVAPCQACTAVSACTSCVAGSFLDSSTSTCLSTCPSQTYAFSTSNGNMQCLSCPSSCLECFDGTACKSCLSNGSRPYLQGTVCQSSCTDGYYSVSTSFTCQACSQWCVACTSSTNCSRCSSAYLFQGACQASCLSAYYPSLAYTC